MAVAEEFLLGRFVVGDGDMSPEQLDEVLAERGRSTTAVPLFGADLIARGLITREALTRAMSRQTSELAYEALRWRAGFFQFRRTDELPLLARDAALQINVDRMLLEGYRRVDEWRIIEREIASFDDVFVRNDDKIADTPRGTFTRDELAVLEQTDGRQTVRDIVRKLRMGSFDVSKMFFRLRRARLVRRRVPPPPPPDLPARGGNLARMGMGQEPGVGLNPIRAAGAATSSSSRRHAPSAGVRIARPVQRRQMAGPRTSAVRAGRVVHARNYRALGTGATARTRLAGLAATAVIRSRMFFMQPELRVRSASQPSPEFYGFADVVQGRSFAGTSPPAASAVALARGRRSVALASLPAWALHRSRPRDDLQPRLAPTRRRRRWGRRRAAACSPCRAPTAGARPGSPSLARRFSTCVSTVRTRPTWR